MSLINLHSVYHTIKPSRGIIWWWPPSLRKWHPTLHIPCQALLLLPLQLFNVANLHRLSIDVVQPPLPKPCKTYTCNSSSNMPSIPDQENLRRCNTPTHPLPSSPTFTSNSSVRILGILYVSMGLSLEATPGRVALGYLHEKYVVSRMPALLDPPVRFVTARD